MNNNDLQRIGELENNLTKKQQDFCRFYILDWNKSKAARMAGYSENGASVSANNNLKNANVIEYIELLKNNLEIESGISKLGVLMEYKKMAFSNIIDLYNDWGDLKSLDSLTEAQKAAIESVEVKERDGEKFTKVKMFDKDKALKAIREMLDYNNAKKIDVTTGGDKLPEMKVYNGLSDDELIQKYNELTRGTDTENRAG